jgi:microcystin-dependent protein
MSNPYIGEIRMFGGTFAPAGWAFCDGQLMPISENDALFTLLGTRYGGDGQETFGIPDLQGRVPLHAGTGQDGNNYQLGEKAGVEAVTLTVQQIPAHQHTPIANSNAGTLSNPGGATWSAAGTGEQIYSQPPTAPPGGQLHNQAILPTGGSQPHDNMGPYLVVTFIISLFGIFPHQ